MDAKHVPRETFDWGQSWTGEEWRVPVVRPIVVFRRRPYGKAQEIRELMDANPGAVLVSTKGTDRLRASPAWRLGVVDTVEELDALEAGADALGEQIGDVADALAADRRELIARAWLQTDVPRGTS